MNNNQATRFSISSFISEGWILMIFFFPLLALFSSLKFYQNPQAKNVFWFFCIFMGMIYIFNPIGKSNADGLRYAEDLITLHENPKTWGSFTKSFYDSKDGFLDLYQPTITFLVSTLTDNAAVLFMVFAFVFGFFYSRNMWFVLDKIQIKGNFTIFILITTYFLINPIWNINGVRMWTACQVFVYGVLPYIWKKDKSKFYWIFVSAAIHFSFFIPILIFLLFVIFPKKSVAPFFVLYLISLFISELNIDQVRATGLILPDLFHRKVLTYTNQTYVDQIFKANQNGGIATYIGFINKWVLAFIISLIALADKNILKANLSFFNLICFTMLMLGISNVLSNIPSGGRFVEISRMFAYAFLALYFAFLNENELRTYSKNALIGASFLFLFALYIPLRVPTVFYGMAIFTNPIMGLFLENRESIYFIITGK